MPDLDDIQHITDSRLDNFCDPLTSDEEPPLDEFTIRQLTVWSYWTLGDLKDGRSNHKRQNWDIDKITYKNCKKGDIHTQRKTGTEIGTWQIISYLHHWPIMYHHLHHLSTNRYHTRNWLPLPRHWKQSSICTSPGLPRSNGIYSYNSFSTAQDKWICWFTESV